MAISDKPERAKHFIKYLLSEEAGGFDRIALQGLQVVVTEPGRVVCRFHVTKKACNRYGTLHGGCIATLVDVVGSAALITSSKRGGVSLAINTLYLNPMPGDEEVEVDARIIKLGRDVGTTEVLLRRVKTGELVATGTHVKKLVGASDLTAFFELVDKQVEQQQVQQQQPGYRDAQQQQAGAQEPAASLQSLQQRASMLQSKL